MLELALHKLGEGFAPVGHGGKPGEAEHHLVEAGIFRTRRGTREFVGGTGGDGLILACETENLLRKLEPGGLALACEVECADELRIGEDVAELARHDGRRGRIAVLVGHDFQHRARAVGERHHRVDEARSAVSVEPGDAADHVVRAVRPHRLLACELAFAVDGVTAGRPVEFVVRAVGIAVEHVVGGDGDQAHAVTVAGSGYVRGSEGIQLVRKLNFAFAFVNGGHGGAVDHRVGLVLSQKRIESRRVGDVGFGQVGDYDLAVLELVLQRAPEHALAAGDEELHCTSSHGSICASSGCFLSFSESRALLTSMRQSMPMAGSLKSTPRSADGV